MNAEIVSIGNEVVYGVIADTNAAYLAARLEDLGATVIAHRAARDFEDEIVAALAAACRSAELVLVTGGLGPTLDDVTREAAAKLAGVELVEDRRASEMLHSFFRARHRAPHPVNLKQATIPNGSTYLPNRHGTAAGFAMSHGNSTLFFMPGVPREMKMMFEDEVVPRLRETLPESGNFRRTLLAIGLGESDLGAKLGDLMQRGRNPEVGTMVQGGIIGVRIIARAADARTAREMVETDIRRIREILGPFIISDDETTLPFAVAKLLEEKGRTIAIAESCTGGLISGMMTEVPGISRFFLEGVVAYSNEAKTEILRVPEAVLERHGSVSVETAKAMAAGVRDRADADIGIAVTGIAGPGGGTPQKPVGMVCFALADDGGVIAREERFGGNRSEIRDRAAKYALNLVRLRLLGVA
jgi:nicotinamide-nucleotide amidase